MKELLKHFHELSLHPKNAKELKGLILQVAIQGKLTADWRARHPEFVSGSNSSENLFQKITLTKKELVRDKKIRKVKALPPIIEDEIPFGIPEEWTWCRMQEVLDVRDGTHDTPKYVSEGVPLVTSKNLYSKKLDFSDIKYISEEDHFKISQRSEVAKDDILFAMIGSIGNPVIVNVEPNFSIKNVALFKYYDRQLINPSFVLYFLENATEEFKAKSDGAVQSFVSLTKLRLKEFPLPPLHEQQEIVNVVETLFKEVEALENITEKRIELKRDYANSALSQLAKNDSKIEWQALKPQFHEFFNEVDNIKKLRETILQLAVQGKLTAKWRAQNPELITGENRAENLLKEIKVEKAKLIKDKKIKEEKALPPIAEDEIPYELPEGWAFTRLGIYTHNFGQKKPVINFEYIDVASIDNHLGIIKSDLNIITPEEAPSRARKIVKRGCVIYSTVRPYLLNIACVDREFENEAIASTAFSILNPISDCSPSYLYYLLRSPYFIEYVESYSKGVAYPAINDKNLQSAIIPIPPLEEQKAIVEKVNALMNLCDQLENEVKTGQAQIEALTQSVLKEVFEGEKELESV